MSFDFNTLKIDDDDDGIFDTKGSHDLIELLCEYTTGIHVFYGMQTEMRKALIEDPDKLLRYSKEQLEDKNIRGHYIVDITKVTHCPYDQVCIGYGTSGINLQLILEYKYRLIQKGVAYAVKASVDHIEKFSTYGDDIPIYGETNKEISGFLVVKNQTKGAKKLIQLAASEYTKKGLVFPVVTYSFEMKANDRNITIIAQPLLPTKPLAFRLLDSPKQATWDHLFAKIELLGDYPTKLQQMLALYTETEPNFEKGDSFYFDTIGATFSPIADNKVKTVGITWAVLMDTIFASYVSLFNLWNYYRNDPNFAKDKYLVEFSKSKMNF